MKDLNARSLAEICEDLLKMNLDGLAVKPTSIVDVAPQFRPAFERRCRELQGQQHTDNEGI